MIHQHLIDELSALVLQGQVPAADAKLYIRAVSERWPTTAKWDASILAAIKSDYATEPPATLADIYSLMSNANVYSMWDEAEDV